MTLSKHPVILSLVEMCTKNPKTFLYSKYKLQENKTGSDVRTEGRSTWQGEGSFYRLYWTVRTCIHNRPYEQKSMRCVCQCHSICVRECVCLNTRLCALVVDVLPNKALIVSL